MSVGKHMSQQVQTFTGGCQYALEYQKEAVQDSERAFCMTI